MVKDYFDVLLSCIVKGEIVMICWMNGQFLQEQELCISPFDHGFLYGLGFFETFRTFNGKVPFLVEHYERLKEALEEFRIAMPFSMDELKDIIIELVERNGGTDGYFRVNVSAGDHAIGLAPTAYTSPNAIVFQKDLHIPSLHTEKTARWLNTVRNTPEGILRRKGHSYGNNVLARFELPSLANEEGFFVTTDGFVAEGITSNIFWAKEGELYTPSLQLGILNGITRQQIMCLANVHEGLFSVQELEAADEVFITTSIQGLVPIRAVGEVLFAGAQGELYNSLYIAYTKLIEQRIKGEGQCN